jgi:hypothetical protein
VLHVLLVCITFSFFLLLFHSFFIYPSFSIFLQCTIIYCIHTMHAILVLRLHTPFSHHAHHAPPRTTTHHHAPPRTTTHHHAPRTHHARTTHHTTPMMHKLRTTHSKHCLTCNTTHTTPHTTRIIHASSTHTLMRTQHVTLHSKEGKLTLICSRGTYGADGPISQQLSGQGNFYVNNH